ncbi:MAG: AAA family ATPase, partial [Gammaproteobacteria bacterium]
MASYFIHRLKIANFKSIDSLVLENVQPFSVFAGANGSGKSNFFDALNFVSLFVRNGIYDALRKYGGYEHVHSQKRRKSKARCFDFEIDISLKEHSQSCVRFKYVSSVNEFDKEPSISEKLYLNEAFLFKRAQRSFPELIQTYRDGGSEFITNENG